MMNVFIPSRLSLSLLRYIFLIEVFHLVSLMSDSMNISWLSIRNETIRFAFSLLY